jgi:hypothetical protein
MSKSSPNLVTLPPPLLLSSFFLATKLPRGSAPLHFPLLMLPRGFQRILGDIRYAGIKSIHISIQMEPGNKMQYYILLDGEGWVVPNLEISSTLP